MKKYSENKKIKILHLLSGLEVGGQEKLVISLIKENMAKNQNDCEYLIAIMNSNVNDQMKQELLSTGVKAYFLERNESSKNPLYIFKLLKIIAENKINIVHSHNTGSKLWSILCKLVVPGLKTVYTIHDFIIIEDLKGLKLLLQKVFIDKNIAVSETIYKKCLEKGLNNVQTIVNCIETAKYKNISPKDRENNTLNIINVARLTLPKKGQDILIQALEICKDKGLDFKCRFVGGTYIYDPISINYLKGLEYDLNLEDHIEFLGNRDDIPDLLAQSDLFVLPSRYEGTPLTLIEAMASGLPVITSKIPGCIEIINDGENGLFFDSEDFVGLAEKIMMLAKNKDLMLKLAENALKTSASYDISEFNLAHSELYFHTLHSAGGL